MHRSGSTSSKRISDTASNSWDRRNLFDAYATWWLVDMLALIGHVTVGFELDGPRWAGGAVTASVTPWKTWTFALRGDALGEKRAQLFYPAARVGSATATVDFHPADHISFRLEYRHDQASAPIYFRARGTTHRGDTLTVGATAWF